MKDKWAVTFTCEKEDGTFYQVEGYADTLVKVSRMITSYQPKRKSELVQINVEKIVTLF